MNTMDSQIVKFYGLLSDIDENVEIIFSIYCNSVYCFESKIKNPDIPKRRIEELLNETSKFVETMNSKINETYQSILNKTKEEYSKFKLTYDTSENDNLLLGQKIGQYLTFVNERIEMTLKTEAKYTVSNHLRIARFYCERCMIEEKKAFMRSIVHWQFGKNNYEKALEIDKTNVDAILGIVRCLFKLSKFQEGLDFLNKHNLVQPSNEQKARYHYCIGKAKRKLVDKKQYDKQYNEARTEFKEAKRLFPSLKGLDNQIRILDQLTSAGNTTNDKKKSYSSEKFDCRKPEFCKKEYFDLRNSDLESRSLNTYRILSIDGGGIRGIIPAVWLCEIEKRTHKPISHLFNMVAGTSTGGIIAGGLAIGEKDGFTPKYRAWDLLDIYLHRANEIFDKGGWLRWPPALITTTYTKEGREKVLKEKFGDARLKDSLTDIVITAAYDKNLMQTYLFNRYDARIDPFLNDTFVDALMCTSAAPTYFPSHEIKGKGIFNDGGVHINNPTGAAISESSRYYKEKTKPKSHYIVSLGTGADILEGYDKQNPTIAFWATKLNKVALTAQAGNTDIALNGIFGNFRYNRWQAWFEKSLEMDVIDTNSLDYLVESAYQFMEEQEDYVNRVVEDLDSQLDKHPNQYSGA